MSHSRTVLGVTWAFSSTSAGTLLADRSLGGSCVTIVPAASGAFSLGVDASGTAERFSLDVAE